MPNIPAKRRRYLYGVSTATVPLLVVFGWVADEKVPALLGVINAVFVGGLALSNVPKDAE